MRDRFRFRAYNPLKKQYFFDVQNMYDDEIECFGYMVDDIYKNGYIVEQCTGLKDKNGKLIYEGDWLKTKDGYYCYVVWYDGFWWIKSLPSEAMDLEHSEFYKECEVIGNIHENPELLEDSDEG